MREGSGAPPGRGPTGRSPAACRAAGRPDEQDAEEDAAPTAAAPCSNRSDDEDLQQRAAAIGRQCVAAAYFGGTCRNMRIPGFANARRSAIARHRGTGQLAQQQRFAALGGRMERDEGDVVAGVAPFPARVLQSGGRHRRAAGPARQRLDPTIVGRTAAGTGPKLLQHRGDQQDRCGRANAAQEGFDEFDSSCFARGCQMPAGGMRRPPPRRVLRRVLVSRASVSKARDAPLDGGAAKEPARPLRASETSGRRRAPGGSGRPQGSLVIPAPSMGRSSPCVGGFFLRGERRRGFICGARIPRERSRRPASRTAGCRAATAGRR